MWEELDQIPWATLKHNYGTAEDVPGLLRAGTDQDAVRVDQALGELDNLLYHQGGWVCSAATAALPFLLELAEGRATAHRHDVVALIWRLAEVGATAEQRFVDPGWRETLAAARARMLALLDDADPRVRREAIVLVVTSEVPHAEAEAALWRRWLQEDDRVTRWDLVLAFGKLFATDPVDGRVWAELHRLAGGDDVQLRFAALQALAESEPALPASRLTDLVEAVLHADAAQWQHSVWIGDAPTAAVRAAGELLRCDPAAAAAFSVRVGRRGDADQRVASLHHAALLLAEWRTATDVLLPHLADLLDDSDPEVRYRAVHLLGCLGTDAAGHADRLAELVDDTMLRGSRKPVTVGDAAVWALARQRDPRCVAGLVRRLTGDRLGFETNSIHYSGRAERVFVFAQPSISEALIPVREYANVLIEPVTARLAATTDTNLIRCLCAVVAAWTPEAGPLVPLLIPLLARDDVWPAAAHALGSLGPAAVAATDALRRRAERETRDPTAAWAWFRVAADPEAVRVLLRMLADEPRHTGVVRRLGDVGQHAAAAIPHLAELAVLPDPWVRIEAAYTHWRISGDPALAVSTLIDVVRPLASATACAPVQCVALRYLGDIGEPAAEAAPLAVAVLANPRRLASTGGWRAFIEDEELRDAASYLCRSIR